MKKNVYNRKALLESIERLPDGKPKMDALAEAIKQADEANDAWARLIFRHDYCYEAEFHDDPPKALPVCLEYLNIFDECSYALSDDGRIHGHITIMNIFLYVSLSLPSISLKQIEDMLAKFYHYMKQYNCGFQLYWIKKAELYRYIDKDKAYECYKKFQEVGLDKLSDCPSCNRTFAASMELMAGNVETANNMVKPMERGEVQCCTTSPHDYWAEYIEYLLDNGDIEEAEKKANILYQKGNRFKDDLEYIGSIIRCWAYTAPEKAIELLEKRFEWSVGMWEQKNLYSFYKGVSVLLYRLAKDNETISLSLPDSFPLWKEDEIYNTSEIARWFHSNALNIARKFDKRNGSRYFEDRLDIALKKC